MFRVLVTREHPHSIVIHVRVLVTREHPHSTVIYTPAICTSGIRLHRFLMILSYNSDFSLK